MREIQEAVTQGLHAVKERLETYDGMPLGNKMNGYRIVVKENLGSGHKECLMALEGTCGRTLVKYLSEEL
jgi:hypothetical protein